MSADKDACSIADSPSLRPEANPLLVTCRPKPTDSDSSGTPSCVVNCAHAVGLTADAARMAMTSGRSRMVGLELAHQVRWLVSGCAVYWCGLAGGMWSTTVKGGKAGGT